MQLIYILVPKVILNKILRVVKGYRLTGLLGWRVFVFVGGKVLLFLLSRDLVADVVDVFVLLDLLELVAG